MNQEIRNYVMQKMSPFLDNGQTLRLERILEEVQLKQENGSDYEEDNAELLEKFISEGETPTSSAQSAKWGWKFVSVGV